MDENRWSEGRSSLTSRTTSRRRRSFLFATELWRVEWKRGVSSLEHFGNENFFFFLIWPLKDLLPYEVDERAQRSSVLKSNKRIEKVRVKDLHRINMIPSWEFCRGRSSDGGVLWLVPNDTPGIDLVWGTSQSFFSSSTVYLEEEEKGTDSRSSCFPGSCPPVQNRPNSLELVYWPFTLKTGVGVGSCSTHWELCSQGKRTGIKILQPDLSPKESSSSFLQIRLKKNKMNNPNQYTN